MESPGNRLAKAVVIAAALEIGMCIALPVMVASLAASGPWPGGAESGAAPHQRLLLRLFTLQPVIVTLWWSRFGLRVITVGLFITWLYRRRAELRSQGCPQQFAPHWAITAWFVPFWNLVAPYLVVRDTWRSVSNDPSAAPPVPIKAWWASVVAEAVVLRPMLLVMMPGGSFLQPRPMELNAAAIADFTLQAIVAASFVGVVTALDPKSAERRVLRGPLLLPAASAVAALALTIGVFGYYNLRAPAVGRELSSGGVGVEAMQALAPPPWMEAAIIGTPGQPVPSRWLRRNRRRRRAVTARRVPSVRL